MKYLEAKALWEARKRAAKMERPAYEDKMLRAPAYEDKAEEPEEEADPEPGTVEDTPDDVIEWPLKMHPASYLGLHPTGQWADTAREILGDDEDTDG